MNAFRALLLTDVVDSTPMSESLIDAAMGELWRTMTGLPVIC
jgi:hypothetical protein